MKKTLLSLAIASAITLPAASLANDDSDVFQPGFDPDLDAAPVEVISTASNEYDPLHQLVNVALYSRDDSRLLASFEHGFDKKTDFDPWNQLANVAHVYRDGSDFSGAIWASFEYGFDKKTDFDPWNQLVNVSHQYRDGSDPSGAIWTSFERGFDSYKAVVTSTNVARARQIVPANVLTQNVWTHHQITGVGVTSKI